MIHDRSHVEQLGWYFCHYEAEVTIRGMSMEHSGSTSLEENAERVFSAHRKARRIEAALFALSKKNQKILRLVYEPKRWPIEECGGVSDHLKGIVCGMRKGIQLPDQAWALGLHDAAHEAYAAAREKQFKKMREDQRLINEARAAAALVAFRVDQSGFVMPKRRTYFVPFDRDEVRYVGRPRPACMCQHCQSMRREL